MAFNCLKPWVSTYVPRRFKPGHPSPLLVLLAVVFFFLFFSSRSIVVLFCCPSLPLWSSSLSLFYLVVLVRRTYLPSTPWDPLPMSRPQISIDRLTPRRVNAEPRESMNCKSCRKRKVRSPLFGISGGPLIRYRSSVIAYAPAAKPARSSKAHASTV